MGLKSPKELILEILETRVINVSLSRALMFQNWNASLTVCITKYFITSHYGLYKMARKPLGPGAEYGFMESNAILISTWVDSLANS